MEVYLQFGARLHGMMLHIVNFAESLILHSDTALCTVLRPNTGQTLSPRNVGNELINVLFL